MKKLYFVPFSASTKRGALTGGFCKASSPEEAKTVMNDLIEKTETLTNLCWAGEPYEWTLVTRHKRAVELLGELRDSLRSSDKHERKIKEEIEGRIASHLAWLDKNAPLALLS